MTKFAYLRTYVDPNLARLIKLLAAQQGTTVSKFIARLLREEAERLCKDPKKAILKQAIGE